MARAWGGDWVHRRALLTGSDSGGRGLSTRILLPSLLQPRDIAAWNALRAAHSEYDTPLLSPEFAVVASKGRADARVALIEDGDGLAAVLAFHARPDGLGRPIGAPFCDYSGPIVREGLSLSLSGIVAAAGLGGYRTSSLLDPWNRFERERSGGTDSRLVRMMGLAPADYLERQRAEYPKRFKNFRRLESLLGRDGYSLRFEFGSLNADLRERMFGFKSVQYRASGLVDLITAPRTRAVLDAVEASPNGFQASLWSGDEMVSADFGFREQAAFHPWIAAYNPVFSHYSPGNLLQKRIIESMGPMGLESYDLADGHDHYKKYFTNSGRTIYAADIVVPGAKGLLVSAQSALWRAAGASKEGAAAGRLRRRIDQAAISFDRAHDRAADLFTALSKRGVSAIPASGHAPEAD
jgi:CelD/BcsL family acetyltransferase involved in cellulose biosynthesis